MRNIKKLISYTISLIIIFHISVFAFASNSVPAAVITATASVVRIMTEYPRGYATGSGFVISSGNDQILVATNYHVVEGNPINISAFIGKDDRVDAHIVCASKQKDLCVLQLDGFVKTPALALVSEAVNRGDEIYAIGFPGSADYLSDSFAQSSEEATITDGIVSATRELSIQSYGVPVSILQINADINPGNSGGPLLDRNGNVVGINTYGVTDAQGIYGAVAVSELIDLLKDNNLPINYVSKRSVEITPLIWVIVGVIGASAVVGGILAFMRKKNRETGKKKPIVKYMTLRQYIAEAGNGLSSRDAVSLLLPVANQILNRHQDGALHLQVTPDTITIVNGKASLASPSANPVDQLSDGYTAPELYKKGQATISSDIYSFAAVLYFAVTGISPENAETRNDDFLSFPQTVYDETIKEILQIALSLNPQNRFDTMQEFVEIIKPYNKEGYLAEVYDNSAESSKKTSDPQRRKQRLGILVPCAILATLLLVYGVSLGIASGKVSNSDYSAAKKSLIVPAVTKLHAPDFVAYIEAGVARENRDFLTAADEYERLGEYKDSKELFYDCLKDYVSQLVSQNNYNSAKLVCDRLSRCGSPDGDSLKQDVSFREGSYILYEQCDYEKAVKTFTTLSKSGYKKAQDMLNETYYLWAVDLADKKDYIGSYEKLQYCKGYENTDEIIELTEELLYSIGVDKYQNEEYSDAAKYFKCIPEYQRSEDYIVLISIHKKTYPSKQDIQKLTKLIGFEDAGDLIFKTDSAFYFMEGGTFKATGFSIKFYEKGEYWYAEWVPANGWNGTWNFKDGTFYVGDIARFYITALSKDSVYVYFISNGRTYTLLRQ